MLRRGPGISCRIYGSRCFTDITGGSIFLQRLLSEMFNMYHAMKTLEVSDLDRITISRLKQSYSGLEVKASQPALRQIIHISLYFWP